ncbi:MAG: NMD3-related protein [Candidatus Micrarchaeota archaeon]
MSALICPKCGRSSDKVAFVEAFCVDCYPVRIECPPKVEVEQCGRCGRARIRGEWTDIGRKRMAEFILSKCRGDIESAEYDEESGEASFTMRQTGAVARRTIPLDIKKTICRDCSRISGGYFEGIIQLRGDPLKVRGHADMLVKRLSKKTFIAKEEEKDEGLDIYVGSSKAALEVITSLGVKTLITKKLIGRDEGKRLYRTTFLLRL